jgi:site-specific recombinase XerD
MDHSSRLTLYRRHTRECPNQKPTYCTCYACVPSPQALRDNPPDNCDCPISCSGYLEHEPERIRHLSLSPHGDTKWDTAHEYARTLVATGTRSVQRKPGATTVKHGVDEYLRHCARDSSPVGRGTLAEYEVFFTERLVPWCSANHKILLTDLEDTATLRNFSMSLKNSFNGKALGHGTRKKFITRLRTFFAFCIESEWIRRNTAKQLGKGVAAATEEDDDGDGAKVGLELFEYERVLAALATYPDNVDTKRLRAIVELMRWCGLRISDAEKFSRSELVRNSTDTGWNASFIQWKLRKYRERARCIVAVPDHVAEMLLALPFMTEEGARKFWFRPEGIRNPIHYWSERMAKLFADAQAVKAFTHHTTPHTLRHTFAIQSLDIGVDIRGVSKMLGHFSLATTINHYAHDTASSKRDREETSREAFLKMRAKIDAIRS